MVNLHRETYQINDRPCTVVADFDKGTINIHAPQFSREYTLDEYENFQGDMESFAKEKING